MMYLKIISTRVVFFCALFLFACSGEKKNKNANADNNGILISIDLGMKGDAADILKKREDTGSDTDASVEDVRLPDTSADVGFDVGSDEEPNKLRIATWNISHLDIEGEGPANRVKADYERLDKYVTKLNADLITLQEIKGEAGARTLFPANIWDVECEDRNSEQNVCVVLRRSKQWDIERHPDVISLRVGNSSLRAGLDFTISKEGFPSIRILAVHMKANCIFGDTAPACTTFFAQIDALETWIDERAATDEAFLVIGDFNRFMDDNDVAWKEIDDGVPARANLVRSLPADASKCWTFPTFIDHIILDNITRTWLNASDQIGYDETDFDTYSEKLSDHCPLWADFIFPML